MIIFLDLLKKMKELHVEITVFVFAKIQENVILFF